MSMKRLYIAGAFAFILIAQGFAASDASAQTLSSSVYYNCPTLSQNLYRGLSDYYTGGQVSALQQFLASRGYSQLVTGYFGPMTANNVAAFQREQGVYPVTGGVGPLTRAAIARVCGGYVPPTPAPSTVTVTSPMQGSAYTSGQSVAISWSTGYQPYVSSGYAYPSYTANIDLYNINGALVGAIAMGAGMSGSYNWTVPTAGTFCTLQYPNGLCGQSLSGQYFIKVSIVSAGTTVATGNSGTITINTGTQPDGTLSATPTYGTAPLTVSFTGQAYEGGNYTLEYGDGTSEVVPVPAIYCITAPCYPPAFTRSHIYQHAGTYTARLLNQGAMLATRTIQVTSNCGPYYWYGCQ